MDSTRLCRIATTLPSGSTYVKRHVCEYCVCVCVFVSVYWVGAGVAYLGFHKPQRHKRSTSINILSMYIHVYMASLWVWMTTVFWGPYFRLFEFYYYLSYVVHFKSWVSVSSKVHSAPLIFISNKAESVTAVSLETDTDGAAANTADIDAHFSFRGVRHAAPPRAINLLISQRNTDRQLWRYVGLQMKEKLSLLIFRFIALVWALEGWGGLLSDLFPLPSAFYL